MSKKNSNGIGYLLKLAGKQKFFILLSAIFSICSALCTFVPFVMVYKVLLFLFQRGANTQEAIVYGITAALAIVGKFMFSIISATFSHLGAFNTLYNVRSSISKHIANINLGFFTNNTSGEIKKVVIEDVERIEKFLAHQIPDLTAAVFVPVIVFIYMLTLSVPMALCILVPVVLGLVIQAIATSVTGRSMPTYHRLLGKLNSTIMQFINGMPIMKTYNMTAEGYKEYADTVTEYNKFWKDCTRDQGYTYGIFVALVESGMLFALPLGGYLYLQGNLPVESYLFFMIMSMVFLSSLLNLINFSMMFSQISGGLNRIKKIADLPQTVEGSETLSKQKPHQVSFKNVTFSYGQAEVLKDVSIDLPAGSLTAFVGASGAGKTTAAQLIPKFWEVTGGKICIDGKNINDLKTNNLMDLVSFVFQETFMLNDTIYNNIAIGSKTATKEQVEAAAQAAQIHDFILSLPDGYQTLLGENGVKMSGGEKQRVCIARAILKDASVISISNMMATLGTIYPEMNYLTKAAENIISVKEEKPLAYQKSKPNFSNCNIAFENVSFRYTNDVEVLHNISFDAKPGTTTALIGPSGSGKTTIVSLISRFWDVTGGRITIGNQDIKTISPDGLTEQMAVVFQDVYLLNDTIANNIRVGKPNATDAEIKSAAEAAQCHEFIMSLPDGYNTMVGEGGSTLSGGEKQRVSIARALIKDAPIVLLDESTSSLDADNEFEINKALDTLMQGKTVIVIAHRLNTIKNAENILVLDNGSIREQGTHTELLQQGGWYAGVIEEQEKARNWAV